jgi:hypothetical protein
MVIFHSVGVSRNSFLIDIGQVSSHLNGDGPYNDSRTPLLLRLSTSLITFNDSYFLKQKEKDLVIMAPKIRALCLHGHGSNTQV